MRYKKYLTNLSIFYSGTASSDKNKSFYHFVIIALIPVLLSFFYLPFFFKIAFCTLLTAFLSLMVFPIIYSLLLLILTYIFASICFFMVGLDFLALCLIFIYVGAIAVLFVFVVMTLIPEKVIEVRRIQIFEKFCFLVFLFTFTLLFIMAGRYGFGEDLILHWFEIYKETGLFISSRGRAEPLTDIGLTLYGHQSYLFILIVLLLFLGFLCPILLTLDEDASSRVPTLNALKFPLTGEYIYFIYFYSLIIYFFVYTLSVNAHADMLNNIEYHLLLKLSLTQIKDVTKECLLEYGDDPLLDTSISGIVYSKFANDSYVLDALNFIPRYDMPKKIWIQTAHDIWKEYIRYKVSLELNPLIDAMTERYKQLNSEHMLLQKLIETGQLSDETEKLLYVNYLQEKTFFDIATLYLVFYISILMEPDDSHSYMYIRSCIQSYELHNRKEMYPLDHDGSLRREALDNIFKLTSKQFGISLKYLNMQAEFPYWSTDFVWGLDVYTHSSRFMMENIGVFATAGAEIRRDPGVYSTLRIPCPYFQLEGMEEFEKLARENYIYPRNIRIIEELQLPFLLATFYYKVRNIQDFFINVKVNSRIFYYQNYILISFVLTLILSFFISYFIRLR